MTLASPFTESFIWKVIEDKGIYDPYLLNKVRDLGLIREGSIFIDAGANIGNHTIYWSKCFPKATVRTALSSLNGQGVESVLDVKSPGNSSVRLNEDAADRTSTLDFVYSEFRSSGVDGHCSFIKIDCEHHDWEVLQGCKWLVAAFNPAIAIEVWPEDLCTKRGVRYLKPLIEDFLFERGYTLHTAVGVNHIYTYTARI
jgi:hypothetical protein